MAQQSVFGPGQIGDLGDDAARPSGNAREPAATLADWVGVRGEWIAAANAARKALAALTAGKHPDEIEPFIAAIPPRSPFGPVRLIVKSLIIDKHVTASPLGPLL